MIKFKAKTATGEIINSALSPFTFPAGEAHLKVEERRELEPTEFSILYGSENMHDDLFQLAMWNDYVGSQAKRVLVLPYLPGARADRGRPFGANVYSQFIKTLYLDQVITFDVHSPVGGDLISDYMGEDYREVSVNELFELSHVKNIMQYDGVIAPDKGAVHRAGLASQVLQVPIYTAEKTRDFDTGKLTGFSVEPLPTEGKYLVVDDICDGGFTFFGLADVSGIPKSNLDLYVSHGVFSKGFDELLLRFNKIYTTNTYIGHYTKPKEVVTLDVIKLLLGKAM